LSTPRTIKPSIFLAVAYHELERPSNCRDALLRAREAVERHLATHPYDARALYLWGSALIQLGEIEEGLRWGNGALFSRATHS
jgi:hypothetical protein